MERKRLFSAAVLLAFALAAILAAGAQAESPAWYECAKATGGPLDKGCATTGGKGGYQTVIGDGKGKTFKGKGGAVKYHVAIPGKGDIPTECQTAKIEGKVAVPSSVGKVVLTLSKCKYAGLPCQTGIKSGEIVSQPLAGPLGYVSHSPLKVGLELTNEAEPGAGAIASFTCTGAAKERWKGAVIGTQTGDINAFGKAFGLVYSTTEAELIPGFKSIINADSFEGEGLTYATTEFEQGKGWEPEGGLPTGFEMSFSLKGEALEIKA